MAGILRRRRTETGASAVELALVMPLFVLLLFGIIAFGIVFAQKLALGNATRQAARFGVVADRTCADISQQVKDAAAGTIAMNTSTIGVTVKRGATAATATSACASATATTKPCAGSAPNDSLFVTTTFNAKLMIPLATQINNFPISGQGVFRCEFS
jgi:Flp pilus assembly protein TadG